MIDFPLDFKRGLKAIWAAAQRTKPSLRGKERAYLQTPFKCHDSLSEVLRHLALKNMGHIAPPLVPRMAPMPIAELCQLVLLWSIAGETAASSELAYCIPLDFPWMWCRESDYCEEETAASVALLKKAIGCAGADAMDGGDPYFLTLKNHLQRLVPPTRPGFLLDWSLLRTDFLQCALTFSGKGTSLGAVLSQEAQIRAFGPQSHPLSNPCGFGIRPIAQHGNRWASPVGAPEVWFDTKAIVENDRLCCDLSFFGLTPRSRLNFSFYVKTDSAQIGNEKLKPNTLHRYQGESKPIILGGNLKLESLTPSALEIIPLAGNSAFWNCEYLISFEIHPVIAKFSFLISSVL